MLTDVVLSVEDEVLPFSVEFVILYQTTLLHLNEWGLSILRPFHQYSHHMRTMRGDRGDNEHGTCNVASLMSLEA